MDSDIFMKFVRQKWSVLGSRCIDFVSQRGPIKNPLFLFNGTTLREERDRVGGGRNLSQAWEWPLTIGRLCPSLCSPYASLEQCLWSFCPERIAGIVTQWDSVCQAAWKQCYSRRIQHNTNEDCYQVEGLIFG